MIIEPVIIDFDSILGDTVRFTVTLNQPKANEADPDVPVNLTGASVAAQCRAKARDTAVLAEFICTILDAEGGEVELYMPASRARAMKAGAFPWDFQVTWALLDGQEEPDVETYVKGTWTVEQDVTRVGV